MIKHHELNWLANQPLADLLERLDLIREAMALPDPRKLKAGVCCSGATAKEQKFEDIFETGSVGFAPAPIELKSFQQWNKEQMEKKCHIA